MSASAPLPAASSIEPSAPSGKAEAKLPTGQKVYTFEHWLRLIGYQIANAAITACGIYIGVLTANPYLAIGSAINGFFQAGLILADWIKSKGQASRVAVMNAAFAGISVGYLSETLKIGSMGLSVLGIAATTALYGIQIAHFFQRNRT